MTKEFREFSYAPSRSEQPVSGAVLLGGRPEGAPGERKG
jgi:hypothetical protein